jgi:uncharacterized caspase-like protein
MKHLAHVLLAAATGLLALPVAAQRMPPMMTVAPQLAQLQALDLRRHQARTLLYKEALEELKRNPRAADYRPCAAGVSAGACAPSGAAAPAPGPEAGPATRRRIAVLIANTGYAEPIPALETPGRDGERVAELLRTRFGYETRLLRDAKKADIARALNGLAAEVGAEDSVLIFYAGHGYLDDGSDMGYWLPVDASVKSAANWISNADIARFLSAVPARQVILVSDSCFSGTLTRELRVAPGAKVDPGEVLRKRSVLVLTSGGEEPVSDEGKEGHSVFAWHFVRVLDGTRALAPGAQVFSAVRSGVERDFPQTPQYGAAISAGHVAGGEYLFQPAP